MKKTYFMAAAFAALVFALGNSGGARPAFTGAPGEETCGSSNCHNVTPNRADASIGIAVKDAMGNLVTKYTAGTTYTLDLGITEAMNANKNGFEIVAIDANENNVGTWELTDADVTRIRSGGGRDYVTHTSRGTRQAAWSVDWVAPSDAMGAVSFYLAVLDADDNGGRNGDEVYTTNTSLDLEVVNSLEDVATAQVEVFPNPATDLVEVRDADGHFVEVQVYDTVGKLLKTMPFARQLDVSDLTTGVYYLQLQGKDQQLVTKKLVIE